MMRLEIKRMNDCLILPVNQKEAMIIIYPLQPVGRKRGSEQIERNRCITRVGAHHASGEIESGSIQAGQIVR